MIHYALICDDGHGFDSWFRDSATFEAQAARGLVACPFCQSTKIARDVMAPHVARAHQKAPIPAGRDWPLLDERQADLRAMIRELRATIVAATEDVGERFPDEARKMEDGEAERRAIRGRASFEEAKALLEDGIEILPLPGALNDGN